MILLEKLTKLARQTELQVAVVLALRVHTKTFRSLRKPFAVRKDNREPVKVREK